MDATSRLRIATRLHFLLLRHLGESVDVGKMLKSEDEAREVVWVCQASGDAELIALAQQFALANAAAKTLRDAAVSQGAAGGHAPQETAWAGDTSGFGVSQSPDLGEPAPRGGGTSVSPSRFNPVNWLRGARSQR